MRTICRLTDSEQIDEACALLHTIYIEKMQWKFCPDNPSQIRIETRDGKKLLVDKFTQLATWFGVYYEGKMIGCTRVQGIDKNGRLELEGYENTDALHSYFSTRKDKCVELVKFAFLPDYVTPGIIRTLFTTVFEYCEKNGYSPLTTTHNSFLKNMFQKIGFPLKVEHAFKYEPHDPLPVNFYFADHAKSEVSHIINSLEKLNKVSRLTSAKIFRALEIATPVLPVPVYWHDKDGKLLGINERGLKGMGTSRNIIGSTPYDLYPKERAEKILNDYKVVMDRGEVLAQEEKINDFTTGQKKYFSSIVAPLYDGEGSVIGVVGTAIDITAEKESECLRAENAKLEIQNQFQNRLIQEQYHFKKIIDQAVHDIRSPLASLLIASNYTKNIPEDFSALIIGASRRINDIANNLLEKYKTMEDSGSSTPIATKHHFQVLLALFEIVSEKKYEFHDLPVEFKISHSWGGYSAFVYAEEPSFKRLISNLINNAVEASDKKPGVVAVHLECNDNSVKIRIQDNGKGMPSHVVDKIKSDKSVTEGKIAGHGIGFTQVREALQRNEGVFDIQSKAKEGTTILLALPKYDTPSWVTSEIKLNQNDIIVVLDDDSTVHKAWKIRFEQESPSLQIYCFELGYDALEFIKKLPQEDKERVFLLADYELAYQSMHGLEVIEQAKIPRSILVTSHHGNSEVVEEVKKTTATILPKFFISEIPISIKK
jgi:PAS domain S-box-containing protein